MLANMCLLTENNEQLEVQIAASYSPPLSFSFKPPSYRAGSSLTLSCVVERVGDNDTGFFYEWTSTCKGNCFSRGETLKTVSSRYLHSYDQGEHTCVVLDRGGCSANASITVDVVGMFCMCVCMHAWCAACMRTNYLKRILLMITTLEH